MNERMTEAEIPRYEYSGWYDAADYVRKRYSKIMPESLTIGGLYMVIMRTKKTGEDPRTATHPVRVWSVESMEPIEADQQQQPKNFKVEFDFLTNDLTYLSDGEFLLKNGFLKAQTGWAMDGEPVTSGYFKSYYSEMDRELEKVIESVPTEPDLEPPDPNWGVDGDF
jgi:hypothetical protein